MKSFAGRVVVGVGFLFAMGLGAGCSSSAGEGADPSADQSGEAVSSADEQRLVSGEVEDLSNIAFDHPQGHERAFDKATPVHVMRPATADAVASGAGAADGEDASEEDPATSESTPETAAEAATNDSSIGSPPDNKPSMTWHGGPVLEHETVYFLYYGNWANTTRTRSLLHSFVNGLHYNDFNHSYWDGLGYKGKGGAIAASRGVTFGGGYGVGYPYGHSLSDRDIEDVVHSVLASGKINPDKNALYFVLPSADVAMHNDSTFCGWHTSHVMNIRFQDNFDVTEDIKYGVIRNANRGTGCSEFGTRAHHVRSPNRDFVADSEVSVISHEMVETMTDPDLNAWYDANGEEDSDKCNFNFQSVRKVSGAYANLYDRRAHKWWLVQSQYRHNKACGMGATR